MKSVSEIQIFGMGVVGACTALQFLELGHRVSVVETNENIERKFVSNQGAVWTENGLKEKLRKFYEENKLSFSSGASKSAGTSVICVGTPVGSVGQKTLEDLLLSIESVCEAIKDKEKKKHVLIVRSTIPPGTSRDFLFESFEKSLGASWREQLSYVFLPEFLREGQAVKDSLSPSTKIFASTCDEMKKSLEKLFGFSFNRVEFETAEMIKYYNNSFHALKVAFANEFSSVASQYGVNVDELTRVFLEDKTLNISPAYLQPGFAYGGACLPKDLACVNFLAKEKGIEAPILSSIAQSNKAHIERFVEKVKRSSPEKIGIIGFGFKQSAMSLRNSPVVEFAFSLREKGFEKIVTSNAESHQLPEWIDILPSLQDVLKSVDLLVIGQIEQNHPFREHLSQFHGELVDLNDLSFQSFR